MESVVFLAIGDSVTDAFITLQDAEVHTDLDHEHQTICMSWGDKIPYESLTVVPGVGNAANAAVAAARLGLNTAFVTNIGKDTFGREILETFKKEKLGTTWVAEHAGIPTNYHFVLSFHSERTILIKHQQYPYAFPAGIPAPKTVYFSSIAQGTEAYHDAVADWLDAHPDIRFAFQPGTFQMQMGAKRLARLYRRTDIFFCNKEEYERILGVTATDLERHEEKLIMAMQQLGPKTCVLTDGRRGIWAREGEGEVMHIDIFPDPAPAKERTGAGDAFSSTTAAYLTMGYSLRDAMLRGTVNAAYVVQEIGAQKGLLSKEELEAKLAAAADR
ncbi:MAG: carbohydrate kinase family protein [Patescibacteria group bacterium]|nr:carbohydrate kinase family protein [Patescibacteria group bacterium]